MLGKTCVNIPNLQRSEAMSFCRLRPNVVFRQALFAYVHTLRAFNGDWRWDPLQAAVGTSDNN